MTFSVPTYCAHISYLIQKSTQEVSSFKLSVKASELDMLTFIYGVETKRAQLYYHTN